jgi:prevent-host-death family protein
MATFNVHEAKTHLSRLLDAAAAGDEVIIAKKGEPYVVLKPVRPKDRVPGAAKGMGTLAGGFFEPLPEEELAAWE